VGVVPAALDCGISAGQEPSARKAGRSRADQNGAFTLSSRELVWNLEWRERRLASTHFENRLSGKRFDLRDVQEIGLTLLTSSHRVEIPWWKFAFGLDGAPTDPDREVGLKLGFHRPDFSDKDWGATENLLLRNLTGAGFSPDPIAYDGYGWFRREFRLPAETSGQPIVFALGGYDHHDWKEYWLFLNGVEIGHRESLGRWRSPGQFVVERGSPAYSAIRFGADESNLLAVRTRAYDRRFGGLSDEVLRHYVYQPVLVDQFITAGAPCRSITDFEVESVTQTSASQATVDLQSPSCPLGVSLGYEIEGPTRRKWLEVSNRGSAGVTLLDVQLDSFRLDLDSTEGGYGVPVFAGDEVFCAIEHPAGINQSGARGIRMLHFPGRFLPPGGTSRSYTSLVSVAETGQAAERFLSYIADRSPRKKKVISIYDTFGVNNQWGGCPTLDDAEMLEEIKILEKWRQRGATIDYFVPDTGWIDHSSDLTEFAPQCFPDGPSQVVKGVTEMGMKFGLWFPVSWGAMSISENPAVRPSLIPSPGEESVTGPPRLVYKDGYLKEGGAPARFCIASEPYFSTFRNAVLHHIRENKLKIYKLDGINSYCNSAEHKHLPGKYSVEAAYNHLIEIAESCRELDPDVALIWYWGVRSPFFALHGDAVFESGLFMEGSGTSWFPTLYYRDSVALNLDQSTRFASSLPPINKDSLGVWLADNRWGNFMGAERWREALVMDLGRGNLMFPQLWGDLSLLDDEDVEFLAAMQSLVRRNAAILLAKRRSFGDPWKNEVYGWAYLKGKSGLIFINNIDFISRKAQIFGPILGPDAEPGAELDIVSHFPDHRRITKANGLPYRTGDQFELWLRPFEVLMLEVRPALSSFEPVPSRQIGDSEAAQLGIPLRLEPAPLAPWANIEFAEEDRFRMEGKTKRASSFTTELPSLEGAQPILAIAVRLRKNGQEWRYSPVVAEVVQVVARIGTEQLVLIPVPDGRQYGNTQKAGCSWVVYKARIKREWSRQKLEIAVHSYLPEAVEAIVDAWIVKEWWSESRRPSPDGFYADAPS
jgi:hypothetical protein